MRTARSSTVEERGSPYIEPRIETPLGRDPLDRDPSQEGTWDQGQRPPRKNMGPGSQTGSDIIQRPPPVSRMTHTSENITLR